jgi:hypothetical protein
MKFLFTIAFIVTSIICPAQKPSQKLITYKKEDTQFNYPSGWKLDTSAVMGTTWVVFSPLKDNNDKFRENVNLLVQDLTGQNFDLDKYTQLSVSQISQMMTDGKVFESTRMKSGNGDYQKVIFSATQGKFKLKFEQYYFVKSDKAYVLTYTAEQTEFDAYKPTGEQILNSFIFTE